MRKYFGSKLKNESRQGWEWEVRVASGYSYCVETDKDSQNLWKRLCAQNVQNCHICKINVIITFTRLNEWPHLTEDSKINLKQPTCARRPAQKRDILKNNFHCNAIVWVNYKPYLCTVDYYSRAYISTNGQTRPGQKSMNCKEYKV